MNVLVTGGAGYIGSHTAKALARAGHQPVVFDNLSRGHSRAVQWGPLVQGDLADRELVEKTLVRYGIQAVLHFAAFIAVGESMQHAGLYFSNNTVRVLDFLEVMRERGIRNFVFSSTAAVYGDPEQVPLREDHPTRPVSPYGESKLFVEKLLRWYGQLYGFRWTALRYFNAAGADPDGDLGECHEPETHLIPLVLEAALDASRPICVFGTDYDTPDGTAVRDYIHVSDLADAHVAALQYLENGGSSQAFNLGTGQGYSVRQVLREAAQVTGRSPAVVETGRRPGDPPVLVADPGQALARFEWAPRLSSLETILQTAWRWRTQPKNR